MSRKKTGDPRKGIDVSLLIGALQSHALGEKEMASTQVNAAIALLKKVLPDLPAPVRRPAEDKTVLSHEEALLQLE